MPAHILVPLDGSSFGEQALRYAQSIASRADAMLHLVKARVIQPGVMVPDVSVLIDSAVTAELAKFDAEYLEGIADGLRAAGLAVTTAVVWGPADSALADYVEHGGIDLVVMATHGRGGLSRAWLGSVADRLVRSISQPVLLLKPRDGGPDASLVSAGDHRILIPLDGSEASEAILDCAVGIGTLLDAQYTLMQVIPPPVEGLPTKRFELDVYDARQEATRYLEGVAARLRARGCVVRTAVVMQGQSALGILEQALVEDCSMIAMATHGRTGLSRIALGSVTDKVVRTASAPMLILPPRSPARSAAPPMLVMPALAVRL